MNRPRAFVRWVRLVVETTVDLVAVIVFVVLTNLAVFSSVVDEPIARALFGIVFVFVVPGYALVSALFPEAGHSPTASDTGGPGVTVDLLFGLDRDGVDRGIDGVERVALAFGFSIVLVALLAVGLSFTPFEFALVPVLRTVSAVTILCTAIAAIRRWSVSDEERFRVPVREWIATGTRSVSDADSRFHVLLNVALALAIVLAVGTLASAVVTPPDAEEFTEFYVLTEDDDGELVASDMPDSLSPGEPEPIHVGVENYEHETAEYSVVVQLQRLEGGTSDPSVTERVEVDRFSTTLAPNETSVREVEVTVSDDLTGEDLRLTFLLYDGAVPDTPTRGNAYLSLHLWVDVTAA